MQRSCYILLLCLSFLALIGCEEQLPSQSQSATSNSKTKPKKFGAVPIDWANDPPKLDRVDFATVHIDSPELRATVLRWQAASANIYASESQGLTLTAQSKRHAKWHHESWYLRPYSPYESTRSILCWWSSVSDMATPYGYVERGTQNRPYEVRHIYLYYDLTESPSRKPQPVRLAAEWMPEEGWGAELFCGSDGTAITALALRICPRAGLVSSGPGINFFHTLGRWEHTAVYPGTPRERLPLVSDETFEELHFKLVAAIPEASVAYDDNPAALCLQRLHEMAAAPEEFKRVALQILDELKQTIESDFDSDKIVSESFFPTSARGRSGGNPPHLSLVPGDRALTGAEKHVLLQLTRTELARRRALIEDNFVTMHKAIVKVFPLDEIEGKGMPAPK